MADISPPEKLQVDKRISIALLFAIVLETGAMAWWAGSIDSRLSAIPSGLDARIREVETHQRYMAQSVERIERLLSRLEKRVRDLEAGAGK